MNLLNIGYTFIAVRVSIHVRYKDKNNDSFTKPLQQGRKNVYTLQLGYE